MNDNIVKSEKVSPQVSTRRRSRRRTTAPSSSSRKFSYTTGTISIHSRGFGFISSPSAPDIFAPASVLAGILDGDEVTGKVHAGSDAASKVTLVRRARSSAVGTVVSSSLAASQVLLDPAIGQLTVTVPAELALGHSVLVSLSSSPVLLEDHGDPQADLAVANRMLRRRLLPVGYSEAALSHAEAVAEELSSSPLVVSASRRDLRDLPTITIDDDHSTDLDDAISATSDPDGFIRVWVHISDVAQRVDRGSPMDEEAAACSTSVYLPSFTRHMLPPVLASSHLSLLPGVPREALTVEMRIDAAGEVVVADVYETLICSDQRLNYEQAGRFLLGQQVPSMLPSTVELLRFARAASTRLGYFRAARGGVDASRVDPEPAGNLSSSPAHLLIERLMVAANESVAQWSYSRGLATLYRTHDTFSPEAAVSLEEAAAGFGLYAGLPSPVSSSSFAALAQQALAAGLAPQFWDATFSLLPRARYGALRAPHFGLGSPAYTHFTSPLRRYADLLAHRMIKAYLRGARADGAYSASSLADAADGINAVEQRASKAEADARAFSALSSLRPRQVRSATVISTAGPNVKVSIDGAPGVRGTLPKGTSAKIGQRLKVRVREVDALRGTLALSPVSKV